MLWISPTKFPVLSLNEVHLWLAPLVRSQQEITGFWYTLNAEERQRADRLIAERHRNNFIVARGVLRQLLSNYLNYPANQIKFVSGSFGKIAVDPLMSTRLPIKGCPHLVAEPLRLKFNLSHANQYAIFAFSLDQDLGIDIEHIRADLDVEEIAQRFFSPYEAAILLSLPKTKRMQAFFNCWTRKEAFIKAIGTGLYYPLHEFDVDVVAVGETKIDLNIRDKSLQNKTWSLFSLETISNYASALAVEGSTIEQQKILKFKC